MKKILFVDTVNPVLEERIIVLGYVCEHDLKASKEEIESNWSVFWLSCDKTLLIANKKQNIVPIIIFVCFLPLFILYMQTY